MLNSDSLPFCGQCNQFVPYNLEYESSNMGGIHELVKCAICGTLCDSARLVPPDGLPEER